MSVGDFPEVSSQLSQRILVGIILIGRLRPPGWGSQRRTTTAWLSLSLSLSLSLYIYIYIYIYACAAMVSSHMFNLFLYSRVLTAIWQSFNAT